MGLQSIYKRSEICHNVTRMIGAIQFLPKAQVERCISMIREEISSLDCAVEVKNKHFDLLNYYKYNVFIAFSQKCVYLTEIFIFEDNKYAINYGF